MAEHNDLGTKGEDAAVAFLQAAGHHILLRNYRYGKAEVDIISQYKRFVVFTEVKTRSTTAFGQPEEFVDKKKRRLMKAAAEEYIYTQKLDSDIRFDIISVTHLNGELKIRHIEDAFFHEE
jgi:putative endonuclease